MAKQLDLANSANRWVERSGGRLPLRLRLFCFPPAGSGTHIFRSWPNELPLNIEVCAIRLPGRESRYSEPAFRRLEPMVESLVPALQQFLDVPFVMFGHSMGALLAYEVTRGLLAANAVEPVALFVSAHRAPQLPSRHRALHDLPRDRLIAELKALHDAPVEAFDDEDFIDAVLPTLRDDLELAETYKFVAEPMLSCPVIAMGGTFDASVVPEELDRWRAITEGSFKSLLFEGDHFFVDNPSTSFLPALRRELSLLGID